MSVAALRHPRAAIAACLLATASGALACAPADPITGCEAVGAARPVCGFRRPEDLHALPGGRYLIVSQMGDFTIAGPGTLAIFDLTDDSLAIAYPSGAPPAAAAASWGDPACPGPPDPLSPHGISVSARPDGKLQLLVVNHGGRESVELFEVSTDDGAPPALTWRGCAVANEGLTLNDVAALPDGGFVASHMYPRGRDTWYGLLGMAGFSTGHVVEWREGAGFREVPGTAAAMPNGIAVSADGTELFVNAYLGGEVLRVVRATGEISGRADVAHPDNSQWSDDGKLLVASHDASVSTVLACNEVEQGACAARFSIVELDPATMTTRKLYENEGAPMGAGTAAVQAGDELIIGSFAGDRIVRVALDAGASAAR